MVTPVVAVLTDPEVLNSLVRQETEVEHIFYHPLLAILDPSMMAGQQSPPLATKGGPDWPYTTDFHVRRIRNTHAIATHSRVHTEYK